MNWKKPLSLFIGVAFLIMAAYGFGRYHALTPSHPAHQYPDVRLSRGFSGVTKQILSFVKLMPNVVYIRGPTLITMLYSQSLW